jgi:hypothetical protein
MRTKEDVWSKILGWTGCFFICAGALCTSLRIDPLNIYLLNIGNLSYLLWSIRTKTHSQIVVNSVLLTIYLFGLYFQPR